MGISLADVGINIRIKGLDGESPIDEYHLMGHELMLNAWFPDYIDPNSYLPPSSTRPARHPTAPTSSGSRILR